MDRDVVDLWFRYEEIAMHFNTLIIQFRLQLIGGIGAIGTVASYLIGAKVEDLQQHNWLRALISSGMFVLVAAAAVLDLFYYDRLLRGAVDALLAFEQAHPEIQMSTTIEARVAGGNWAVWWAYGILLSLLFVFSGWSCGYYRRHKSPAIPAA